MVAEKIGRVIAIDQRVSIASKTDATKTFERRKLYMDCTMYNSMTGERIGDENKPLLEFGGKGLEEFEALIRDGLKAGDLVVVKFDIQGTPYKDKEGKMQNFTTIRTFGISRYIPRSQQAQQGQQQQTTQQPAPAPAPQTAAPAAQPAFDAPLPPADGLPF